MSRAMTWTVVILSFALLLSLVIEGRQTSQPPLSVDPTGSVLVKAEESGGFIQTFSEIITILSTLGLVLTVLMLSDQLRATHRSQRIEFAPFVRVDAVPTDSWRLHDLPRPANPYYTTANGLTNLADGAEYVSFSLWLRNLQSWPLGTAYGVEVQAMVEIISPEPAGDQGHPMATFYVPYLQHEKPVQIEAFRVPRDWEIKFKVLTLTYFGLFDDHLKVTPTAGPEAWHGRLECSYRDGVCVAEPIYEPPGSSNRASAWDRVSKLFERKREVRL